VNASIGPPAPSAPDGLSQSVESLLEEWRKMALKATGRHSSACDYYERLDSFYGVGSTVLTAVVGSTVFVTLQSSAAEGIRIAAGVVGVIAAVASGIQTAAKYGQRAERHRQASRHYAVVVRQIAEIRALPPPSEHIQAELDALRKSLDDTGAMAPNVPPNIWFERPGWCKRVISSAHTLGRSPEV
jgi:hypothetical protein